MADGAVRAAMSGCCPLDSQCFAMPVLNTGTRLGPYEILDAIGAGGMGEVYRGRDTRLDRIVAIKVLASGLGSWSCTTGSTS